MLIIFSKFTTWLLSPIGIILILLLILLIKFEKKIFKILIVFFIVITNQQLSNYNFNKLENLFEQNDKINFEEIDSIIILGGGRVEIQKNNKNSEQILIDYSGRYSIGLQLFDQFNINNIVISDISVTWNSHINNKTLKILNYMKYKGIIKEKIIILKNPMNTYQEAKLLADKIKNKKILIVTSAYHSKRAEIIFKSQGFNDLEIYKVDFQSQKLKKNLLNFLPSVHAIQLNAILFKEILGISYYIFFS